MLGKWRDVKDYEGLYQVSDKGEIRKICFINNLVRKPKIFLIKPQRQNSGYLKVVLYKNGKYKNKLLHRIIAETFLENPNGYKEVNHIDGNKDNNKVSNLEWCDRKQNMQAAIKSGLWVSPNKGKFGSDSSKAKPVKMISPETYEVLRVFGSIIEGANFFGKTNGGSISSCCNKKRKLAHGYIWEYEN